MAGFEYQRINREGKRTGGFYLETDEGLTAWVLKSGKILGEIPREYSQTTPKEWSRFWVIRETTQMPEWHELPTNEEGKQVDRVWCFSGDKDKAFAEHFGVGCDHRLKTIATIVPGLAKIEELVKACDFQLDGVNAEEESNPHDASLKSIEEIKVHAEAGNVEAMCSLGIALVTAPPQYRDYNQGMRWLRKASAAGMALATYNIGVILRDGYSGEIDFKNALKYFDEAASVGYAMAKRSSGIMRINGEGCPKNQAAGYRMLLEAAKSRDYHSFLIIGSMHLNGVCVKKNPIEGAAWLLLALKMGLAVESAAGFSQLNKEYEADELKLILEKAEVRTNVLIDELCLGNPDLESSQLLFPKNPEQTKPSPKLSIDWENINPTDPKGYYAYFGVKPDASVSVITRAYNRILKECADNAFVINEANMAYKVLSNPHKRRFYDRNQVNLTRREAQNHIKPDILSLLNERNGRIVGSPAEYDPRPEPRNQNKSSGCILLLLPISIGIILLLF